MSDKPNDQSKPAKGYPAGRPVGELNRVTGSDLPMSNKPKARKPK